MVFDNEVIMEAYKYSVNNEMQEVYAKDVPKNILDKFKEINKECKKIHEDEFIKIIPGHEMINGKPVSIKKINETYICYVDRATEKEVKKLKEYDEMKKKETGENYVTFLKN